MNGPRCVDDQPFDRIDKGRRACLGGRRSACRPRVDVAPARRLTPLIRGRPGSRVAAIGDPAHPLDPVDPASRPQLKDLGEAFEEDANDHPAGDAGGVGDVTIARLRERSQASTLDLDRFWIDQRAALATAEIARTGTKSSEWDAVDEALDEAGVGDAAFAQLLENWAGVTSPFDTGYDVDEICKAGQSVLDGIAKIRAVVEKRPGTDPVRATVDAMLTMISERIGERALALAAGTVVAPASAENRAKELVELVGDVADLGRDPLADPVKTLTRGIKGDQSRLGKLSKNLDAAKDHVDPAKRQKADADLATVTTKLTDPSLSDSEKAALQKQQSDLTTFLADPSGWAEKVRDLTTQTGELQSRIKDRQTALAAQQQRVTNFDAKVGDLDESLHSGDTTSVAVLADATRPGRVGQRHLAARDRPDLRAAPRAQHLPLRGQAALVRARTRPAHRLRRRHRASREGALRRVHRQVGRALPRDHPPLGKRLGGARAVPGLQPRDPQGHLLDG
jgi:hypothetical protein